MSAAVMDIKNHLSKTDHAVLLVCPKEEELKETALSYFMGLYCAKEPPCKACTQCRRVAEGIHPDILTIQPDEASIKVKQVRQIPSFIAEKAYEGGKKAVLIEKADLMTPEAQNCLLKPMEEPPENTVFVLLARSENTILPTIASRCKRIKIKPAPLLDAALRIMAAAGVTAEEAALYAALSDGYVNNGVRMAQDENFKSVRSAAVALCEKLCTQNNMGIQKHADVLEEQKENFLPILKTMLSYFYDMQWLKLTGNKEGIKNKDRLEEIAIYSLNFTRSALSNIIDLLCEMERRQRFALNYRLMVESMLFHILEVKQTW